jgi:release factor glutamine methyltransferase
MTFREATDRAAARLKTVGVLEARLEAEKLLGKVMAWSRLDIISNENQKMEAGRKAKFDALVSRREKREPLQYITGTVEFHGLKLEIDKRALIPRPETEQLVDIVLAERNNQPLRMLDACTGSGAVALAVKKAWGALEVTASDLSLGALQVARANARRLKLDVHFVRADLFDPFVRPFHFITVNPPYIADNEYAALQPEVRDWEPRLALAGGRDGLDVLRRIPVEAAPRLWPGGLVAVEIAPAQAGEVVRSFEESGAFDTLSTLKDFQGLDRFIVARRWKSS